MVTLMHLGLTIQKERYLLAAEKHQKHMTIEAKKDKYIMIKLGKIHYAVL
jgi:hypothetical protein